MNNKLKQIKQYSGMVSKIEKLTEVSSGGSQSLQTSYTATFLLDNRPTTIKSYTPLLINNYDTLSVAGFQKNGFIVSYVYYNHTHKVSNLTKVPHSFLYIFSLFLGCISLASLIYIIEAPIIILSISIIIMLTAYILYDEGRAYKKAYQIISKQRSKDMQNPPYKIQIKDRGELISYVDSEVQVFIERTHINGDRIYCDSLVKDTQGNKIAYCKKQEIMSNLCDYFFKDDSYALIFVIDDADKDKKALERYIHRLKVEGYKIEIEYDSAQKRAEFQHQMNIEILNAGKKLTINGTTFNNAKEYIAFFQLFP